MRPEAVAWVLGVDGWRTVRYHLRETTGRYAKIRSLQEVDGALWLGSLFGQVAVDPLIAKEDAVDVQ